MKTPHLRNRRAPRRLAHDAPAALALAIATLAVPLAGCGSGGPPPVEVIVHLERDRNDPGLVDGNGRFGMESYMRYIDRVHELEGSVALLDTHATSMDEQWFNIAGYLLINNSTDYVATEN